MNEMMLDTSSYDCKGCDQNVECNTSDQQTIAILNMTLNSIGTVYFQCSSLMYSNSDDIWPANKQIEIFSNVMKLIVKEGMCSICIIFCM